MAGTVSSVEGTAVEAVSSFEGDLLEFVFLDCSGMVETKGERNDNLLASSNL